LKSPKISVVVLTKNRRDFLKNCLYSLFNQSYADFEIIVVDDQSIDDTENMVKGLQKEHPNLKFIQRDGMGLANGRNCGIRASNGEIIAFTDDDCETHPDWIKRGTETLESQKIDFVKGPVYYPDGRLYADLDINSLKIPTCNIFYKKNIIEDIGLFDERFTHGGEDLDLAVTALEKGYQLAICSEAIVYHPFPYKSNNPLYKPWYMLRRFWKIDKHRYQNFVLLFKKHKDYRKKLSYGIFYNKTHIISIVFTIILFISIINFFTFQLDIIYFFMFCLLLISYLPICVFTDKAILKYPIRILFSPFYIFLILLETWSIVKGAIRYRYFIL
jgi:GT2 family glycosyltransferase